KLARVDENEVRNMKEQWLKLSLQFFNDAGTEEDVSDENVETEPTQEVEELSESQMKLVNDRVNEEMARRTKEMRQQIQDELTEKQKEADKLRKMNAEQKHQYELEKAEKERDDYKQQLESYKMRQEAMAMFNEAGMQAPESLLNMVVQDTAEATKEAVDSFVSMVNQEVQRQLESKATQNHVVGNHVTTPNNNKNTPQKVELNFPF
ncbi:capsid assembly scaffolding protein Gp46 family protein, partial [Staphylococcus pseudintermedius]|uniref:capsid assembly scaffolding protein Gp46 family protein n=9 Tax=Staphylococcus pseudintermedius TaxID=283734 RepID=UPI001F5B3523